MMEVACNNIMLKTLALYIRTHKHTHLSKRKYLTVFNVIETIYYLSINTYNSFILMNKDVIKYLKKSNQTNKFTNDHWLNKTLTIWRTEILYLLTPILSVYILIKIVNNELNKLTLINIERWFFFLNFRFEFHLMSAHS